MAKIRQLLLLRHAKSSWDDAALADFDRPLAPRGRKAAPRMAEEILKRGWLPDLALVSPSVRTRETWQLASARWPVPKPPVAFPDDLYLATARELLAEVQSASDAVMTLLVVAHNPGLEDFALQLAGSGSDDNALKLLADKFSTGALARLQFEGAWNELHFGSARLTHCLRPKDLN